MISQNLFLSSMMFLRQGNMSEHDQIFVFVYVNSLFNLSSGMWVGTGSRGISTIGVRIESLFMRGVRAVEK